ncbi:hypothetical protein G210_1438 [Candida maltosa Xu316]|uniref:Uncharacterized protein n=1 Tax=Candida maltosa (strain Xu316) TaxID=1245528 RepID=M3JYL0_CANMX|nr:hypothetical protein G210_1438 [Candida maltosa Xu316]
MRERKRSLSPNTETSFSQSQHDDPTAPRKPGISSYFSKLKQSLFSSPASNHQQQQQQQQQTPPPQIKSTETDIYTEINIDGPLLNNFKPSEKRRRLSIQGHPSPQGIPRSSIINGQELPRQRVRSYSILYNDVKTNDEELNNDLEVRVTAKEHYGDNLDVDVDVVSRDFSPFVELPQAPNSDIIMRGLDQYTDDSEQEQEQQGQQQILTEYAPLYQDEYGNLVRPPFINLDPRERYQLLQLKRSLEMTESLQNRIKYMVNPNELVSKKIRGTNKVETSTQTHDVDYLHSKLNFKRKADHSYVQAQNPKRQKKRGFYMQDFMYDVKSDEPVASKSSLSGYLGNISKPQFNTQSKSENKLVTQIVPREDEDPVMKKFGETKTNQSESKSSGGINGELKLDEEYVKKAESISDIIKLKDTSKVEPVKSSSVAPSSGFKFNIKKDDFENVIKEKKQNDESIAQSKLVFNQPKPDTITEKKDIPEQAKQKRKLSGESKPSVSFGFKPETKSTPSLSLFGNTCLDKTEPLKENSKPFSFGKPSSTTTEPASTSVAPKFSFGKPAEPASKPVASGGLFNFGNKTTEEPKKTTESEERPSTTGKFEFNLGNKDSKPTFSFGKKDDDDKKPAFSFGKKDETKDDTKNVFDFGKKDTSLVASKESTPTTPTTLSSTNLKLGEQKGENSLFSFSKPTSTTTSNAPSSTFSFGNKETEKKTTTDGKEDDGPSKKKSTFETPSTKAFSFSFDNGSTSTSSKPAFNLSTTSDKKDTGVVTSTPASTSATPFGSTPKPVTSLSNPNFKFAAGAAPVSSGSGSGFTAKPFTTTSFNFSAPSQPFNGFTGAFGAAQPPQQQAPFGQPNNSFGQASASPAFGSRPTTPVFNFGGSNTGTLPLPAPMPSKVPQFNFTGSKESTPDPASIFGQSNRSTSSTPFGNGMVNTNNNNMFGQQQPQPQQGGFTQQQAPMFGNSNNNSFTFGNTSANGPMVNGGVPTPVANPRRIIQPRSRRR